LLPEEVATSFRASIDPWPKFRSAHLSPWSDTCWGCHPKPAFDRRSAPVLWRCRAGVVALPRHKNPSASPVAISPDRAENGGRFRNRRRAAAPAGAKTDTTKVDGKTH